VKNLDFIIPAALLFISPDHGDPVGILRQCLVIRELRQEPHQDMIIPLRWQLITNRKSYNGLLIATEVDDLEWPWTSIHCSVLSCMRVATKWLKLQARDFHYKVALYHSYLPIKFDDIQRGPSIWGSQNRVGWFSTSWHHILKTFSKTVRDRA